MLTQPVAQHIELWPIDKFIPYARNPRKNDAVVDRMAASAAEQDHLLPALLPPVLFLVLLVCVFKEKSIKSSDALNDLRHWLAQ